MIRTLPYSERFDDLAAELSIEQLAKLIKSHIRETIAEVGEQNGSHRQQSN